MGKCHEQGVSKMTTNNKHKDQSQNPEWIDELT